MLKTSPISRSDETSAATCVADDFQRLDGAQVSQVHQQRRVRANPLTRGFSLAIWALSILCLGLGALVWWQLLRALP